MVPLNAICILMNGEGRGLVFIDKEENEGDVFKDK